MKFAATVQVHYRPGTLDPQGQAVLRAIRGLGHESVGDVRIGKSIRLELQAPDADSARTLLEELSRDLLANPVLEAYEIELHEVGAA